MRKLLTIIGILLSVTIQAQTLDFLEYKDIRLHSRSTYLDWRSVFDSLKHIGNQPDSATLAGAFAAASYDGYRCYTKDGTSTTWRQMISDGTSWNELTLNNVPSGGGEEAIIITVTDETTAITTGTLWQSIPMPYAATVTNVRAFVTTAPSGGLITVDINEAGSSILSTKLTIDDGENKSTTAATPPVISDTSLADFATISIDVDVVNGSPTGLKVAIYYTRQ